MTLRPRLDRLLPIGCLGLCVLGCSPQDTVADEGGQTGSAACGTSPRCICDSAADAEVVRGLFTYSSSTEAHIEVLETFGSGQTDVGDTVTGPFQVGFPCGLSSLPPLTDGTEVLLVSPPAAGELPQTMYLVAWGSTLQLTPEFSMQAADAEILVDAATCSVQFPDREIVCKDTF